MVVQKFLEALDTDRTGGGTASKFTDGIENSMHLCDHWDVSTTGTNLNRLAARV